MTQSFDETRFTPEQIAELKASAISPEIVERAGVYSVADAKGAAKLFGRMARQWDDGRVPVLVYPYRIPFQQDPVAFRGKPARPFEDPARDGSARLVKYVQAKNTGVHIAFGPSLLEGPALRDAAIPLWLTEGEKKMLAAESHGLSCIALPGVSQWHLKGEHTLHPYFAHVALEGRSVFLAFDADALSNKDVRREELALGRALEKAGARVFIVRFPQEAAKLDDFLATHELSELHQLAAQARAHGRLPPDTSGTSSEEWKPVFEKLRLDPATNQPVKDVDNVTRILMHHADWQDVFAFDARRERQIFKREPPFSADIALEKSRVPRAVTDSDVTRIGDWLVAQGCLGWSTQPKTGQLEQAIAIVCERHRFDAVRDYLVSLTWDGTARLDRMAVDFFGAKDTVYTSTVVAKWMLSAVARAREPGCQVDHVLVLEGRQGLGKSTALRILAGADFFSDTLPEIPSRDALEHCVGPWVIELAELDHMRKSEVTALKAFISTRAPSFRSAYARRTVEHPRRCVFAATTNESTYLADGTGNRRFWPIECAYVDVEAVARDRDQLWAEALARVRSGESWHITDPEVTAEAEEEQAARRVVDPWHDVIALYVSGRRYTTVADILDHLGHGPEEAPSWNGHRRERTSNAWRFDQRSANRVAAILRDLGWVRRQVRIDGARVWRYEAPDAVTRDEATGDGLVTGQVIDFKGKSPASPVSPPDAGARACAPGREAGARVYDARADGGEESRAHAHTIQKGYTGDSSDSGDKTTITGTYPSPLPSPPYPPTSDSPPPRPRRRL